MGMNEAGNREISDRVFDRMNWNVEIRAIPSILHRAAGWMGYADHTCRNAYSSLLFLKLL